MSSTSTNPIIIVGAGWAGLSAALTLSRAGKKVMLLEAAPQIGGRARAVSFAATEVDNGQHLFMGAYQSILTLLKWLQIPESSVFHRTPLEMLMWDAKQNTSDPLHLKLPNLPAPFHVLLGMMTIKGLKLNDRLKAIQFCRTIQTMKFHLKQDVSVLSFLQQHQQPDILIQNLWGPLALAALSTPLEQASACVFLHILKEVFEHSNNHSNWLFPKVNLSKVLPDPLLEHLNSSVQSVLYHQRVQTLVIENGRCIGVRTPHQTFKGHTVILATPPSVTANLLAANNTNNVCKPLVEQLLKFQYQPITTLYLSYANPVQLKTPMIGLINSMGHWVFDRKIAGQPNIVSVVFSGTGPHNDMDHISLIKHVSQELHGLLPSTPIDARVITEKRAAFSCDVGIDTYRPTALSTPLSNLWLAGDYTEPFYPATLEGAVKSGMNAANQILFKDNLNPE